MGLIAAVQRFIAGSGTLEDALKALSDQAGGGGGGGGSATTIATYDVTGKSGTVAIPRPTAGMLILVGVLGADLFLTFPGPSSGGQILPVLNDTTAAAPDENSHDVYVNGLWVEPTGSQALLYDGSAWRYGVGSGKAYVFTVQRTSAEVAGTTNSVLAKIPGQFQTRDVTAFVAQAPVGSTVNTTVSSPTAPGDLMASADVGSTGSATGNTGSTLSVGPYLNDASYDITVTEVVGGTLTTPATVEYTITVLDISGTE